MPESGSLRRLSRPLWGLSSGGQRALVCVCVLKKLGHLQISLHVALIACAANISHSPSGVCSTAYAYARISPNQYSEEQQPLSRLFGGVCMPFQTFGAPVRCVFVLGPSLLLSHGASQSLVRLSCVGPFPLLSHGASQPLVCLSWGLSPFSCCSLLRFRSLA